MIIPLLVPSHHQVSARNLPQTVKELPMLLCHPLAKTVRSS